jgi:hypothetical protein
MGWGFGSKPGIISASQVIYFDEHLLDEMSGPYCVSKRSFCYLNSTKIVNVYFVENALTFHFIVCYQDLGTTSKKRGLLTASLP